MITPEVGQKNQEFEASLSYIISRMEKIKIKQKEQLQKNGRRRNRARTSQKQTTMKTTEEETVESGKQS
jgi:hypothetical protein